MDLRNAFATVTLVDANQREAFLQNAAHVADALIPKATIDVYEGKGSEVTFRLQLASLYETETKCRQVYQAIFQLPGVERAALPAWLEENVCDLTWEEGLSFLE
jgi:hypothetical protein